MRLPEHLVDVIVARSDALTKDLVAPPSVAPDVCSCCRSWNDRGEGSVCTNCIEVQDALGVEPVGLSVASLYKKPSQLRNWLTGYKGRPGDEDEPFVPEYPAIVEAMLGRFLHEHGNRICAEAGGVDCITIVPSTNRMPPHPLETAIEHLELDTPVQRILVRGPGALDFRNPVTDGYLATTEETSPKRVLLVDDVYTTGARISSAAYALQEAGYLIAGALVLARRVNPNYHDAVRTIWERQAAKPYDWKKSPVVVQCRKVK